MQKPNGPEWQCQDVYPMHHVGRVVHQNVGVAVGAQAPRLGGFQQHGNIAQRENRRRDGAGDEFEIHVTIPRLSAESQN